MPTIDKLDIGVYIQYARRTQMVEQINQQFRLKEADSIPPQLQLIDIYPKLAEIDILLGVIPVTTPWAYFFAPKNFDEMRRSAFTFSRVVPSVNPLDDAETDEERLEKEQCGSKEEEDEKKILSNCLSQVKKINNWLGFVIGRMGQFLQG